MITEDQVTAILNAALDEDTGNPHIIEKEYTFSVRVYARPNPYPINGEEELEFYPMIGPGEPYWDNAFLVGVEDITITLDIPKDINGPQIESITNAMEREKDAHYEKVRRYQDRIQKLLALPETI